MTNVVVIMGERGEYSDRSVWPVEVVDNETVAQERIVILTKLDRINTAVESARYSYVSGKVNEWTEINPRPEENLPEKPKFDHAIDQRIAQRNHQINLAAWQKLCVEPVRIYRENYAHWSTLVAHIQETARRDAETLFTAENVALGPERDYDVTTYFYKEVPRR